MPKKRIISVGILLVGVVLISLWFFLGTDTKSKSVSPSDFRRAPAMGDPGRTNALLATEIYPGGNSNLATGRPTTPVSRTLSVQTNAHPADPPAERVNDNALRQIAALQREKASRTAIQQKIDSQLLYAERMRRGESIAEGIPRQRVELAEDDAGRVEVDITAKVTDELLKRVADGGGKVINSFAQYEAIRAWMPLAQIEPLAARGDVKFIRPAVKAFTHAGSVVSEGYFTHKVNVASNLFHVSGAGVRVGVLSDSNDYLNNSQASGELGNVTVLPGREGTGQGEGTAMLEIVHDLAPNAQLFFSTGDGGPAAFAQSIRDLHFVYGCDVIVDDLEYFNESPFQDGIVAQAVNAVTEDGALYFSSASNSGNKNDNSSGTWEGDFVDGGTTVLEAGRIHDFGPAHFNTVAPGGYQRRVDLFWSDPLGAAANDYDVFVLDADGTTVVASSTNPQTGVHDPWESVGKLEAGQRIVIIRFSGASRYLHLEVGRGYLSNSTAGRTKGHSAASDAFSVAAVDVARASYTNAFVAGAKNPVESFSSDGPRRVFYYADGTPITPGNFSSTGGMVRQKPDIAAADGVRTSVPGFAAFFGTSAAAPHAAAIAALLKSYNPSLTPAQIRAAFTGSALDIEAAGVDRDSGYGIVMAEAALQAVPGPSLPTIAGFVPSGGAVGTAVTITGTKFNGATRVNFNGVSAVFTVESATQLTAVVPAGATTGLITVTTSGGTAASADTFDVATTPVVTSFTPTSGAPETSVVINGVNFTGATNVNFNGAPAAFTIDSATKITAAVPANATTGRITVKTTGGTATSVGNFTVTPLPVVAGFSPSSGGIGTVVVVTGANFSTTTNATFNGVSASVTIDSATQLTLTVPAGATTGPIAVASPAGSGRSATDFVVIATPSIGGFSPSNGPVGALVTINGSNFANATEVRFNGTLATFTVDSSVQITATVPAGASAGVITVRTPGGLASSVASFTVVNPPGNDNFAAAQDISGAAGTVAGNNSAATKEPGEPDHAGNIGGKSIWYRWTAPGNGTWTFDTSGSSFDTTLALYTGLTLTNLTLIASNDDAGGGANSAVTVLASGGQVYWIAVDGYNNGTGGSSSAAAGNVTAHWALTVSAPVIGGFSPTNGTVGTRVTIQGANFASPVSVKFNGTLATATLNSNTITATVPEGATTGPITLTTPGGTAATLADFIVLNPSSNDHFANAQLIAGNAGTVTGSNVGATKEAGEPNHAGNTGGKSVWYRWVAPANGAWVFDTRGGNVDTLLAVYSGSAVNNLTLVVSNDDSGAETASSVAFVAVGGQEYRLAVDGVGGSSGPITLNWRFLGNAPAITDFTPIEGGVLSTVTITGQNFSNVTAVQFNGVNAPGFATDSLEQVRAQVPAGATTGPITLICEAGTATSTSSFVVTGGLFNDDFANARQLAGSFDLFSFNSLKATKEAGEPDHAGVPGGRSLWFYWIAPSTGAWTFDTAGSGFDTLLAVYTGSSVTNLSLVTSNDDSQGFTFSSVTFAATSNTVYRIALDGYNGAGGEGLLRYQPALLPIEVYKATFETAQGYAPDSSLAGQQGWVETGTGGNGIVTNFFPGSTAQAYLGFNPGSDLVLERPFNYIPDPATRPIVKFTVKMRIYDSTNFRYDHFRWRFINQASQRLFTIDFNNADFSIVYVLDGAAATNQFATVTFDNHTIYTLTVALDFANNLWTATLDDKVVALNQPITTTHAALNLRSVAVAWVQDNVGNPGDNFMVFDDYTISAEAAPGPSITGISASRTATPGTNTSMVVLAGGSAPFSYQWKLNGQDISGATNAIYAIPRVSASDAGSYTVVVKNASGTVTSDAIVLTVEAPPALLLAPLLSANGLFQFQLNGVPGQVYTIQSSTNLSNWVRLLALTNQTGEIQVTNSASTTIPRRFYRVVNGDQ